MKMRRWKKISSLILAGILCVSLLSAVFPVEAYTTGDSDTEDGVITEESESDPADNVDLEYGGDDEAEESEKPDDVEINDMDSEVVDSESQSMEPAADETGTDDETDDSNPDDIDDREKSVDSLTDSELGSDLDSREMSAVEVLALARSAESDIAGRVVTGESGINLVNNAGFEHGGDNEAEAWGKSDNVEINTVSGFIHSGSRSMKVAAGKTETAYAFSGLNDIYNREAAVSAGIWVYLSDASDAEKTLIVLERKGGGDANLLVRPQAQTGWQKVIFSGDTVSGCNEHVIKFEVAAGNAGDIYFDDAFVYSSDAASVNLLRNSGFESNLDSFGQGGDGTASVSGSQVHSGGNALQISGAKDVYQASGWWPNKQSANTGATMYFSAWVKSENAAGSLKLRAEVKYGSPEQVHNYESDTVTGTADWQQLWVEIPYPGDYVGEMLFHIETTGGAGTFWVDSCVVSAVKPVVEEEEPKTPGEVNTGETGYNLLNNPGLERLRDAGASEPFEDWGSFGIENAAVKDTRTGTGAVYAPAGAGGGQTRYLFSGLNRYLADYSKELRASVWVKLKDAADASKVKLICECKYDGGQQNFIQEAAATTEWQQIILNMEATAGCQESVLKLEIEGTCNDVWADDFYLSTKDEKNVNFLRNGKFEDGENAWANAGGQLTAGEGIDGSTALKMDLSSNVDYFQSSGWWGGIPQDLSYTNREDMTYSVCVKSGGGSGVFRLRVERKEGNPELISEFTVKAADTEWQEVSLELPALDIVPTEGIFHIEPVSGSGILYFDNARLSLGIEKTDPPIPTEPGDNYVSNGDFEQIISEGKEADHWGLVPGWDTVPGAIEKTTVHGGNYAIRIPQGQVERYLAQSSNWIDKNTTPEYDPAKPMLLTAYVYYENLTDAGAFLKVECKNGENVQVYTGEALKGTNGGWKKVELYLPPSETALDEIIVGVVVTTGSGVIYVDDVSFQETEKRLPTDPADPTDPSNPVEPVADYVSNGDFEQVDSAETEAAHWGLVPGWDTVPGAIEKTTVHGGNYAIRIPQGQIERYLAQSSNWIDKNTTPEYDPAKPMLLTAYVKYENLTGAGAFLKIECKNGKNVQVYMGDALKGTSGGWKKIELYLPPAGMALDEIIVGVVVTAGNGVIYVDDVSFQETERRPWAAGQNAGNGGTAAIIQPNQLPGREIEQNGFNWLGNPGFEKDMQDWGVVGRADIVTDVVHQGEKALRMQGEAHLWNVVSLNLERSRELAFSVWVKLTDVEDAEKLTFFFARKDAQDKELERYTFSAQKTGEWQKISVIIPASQVPADILVFGVDTLAGLAGSVYLDDCYLTYRYDNPAEDVENLVANGSFEFGTDKPLAWGAIPEYDQGTEWIDQAKEGKLATALYARNSESTALFQSTAWGNNPSYDYGAPLLLTAYANTSSLQNGCLFKIERKYKDKIVGEPYLSEMITGTSNGWKKVEVYLPPTDQAVDEVIVGVDVLPGSGSVLVDDVKMVVTTERADDGQDESGLLKNPGLEKLNPDGSILHWDVWPGNPEEGIRQYESVTDVVHSGERALKLELTYGNGQAVYQYRVMEDNPFDFNCDYEASVWIKMENVAVYDGNGVKFGVKRQDAEGNEYNLYTDIPLGSTEDWIQVKLPAPKAKADIIQYDVIVDIGAGSGVIYLDDFDLIATEIELVEESVPMAAFTIMENDPQVMPEESVTETVIDKKQRNLAFPVAGGISFLGVVAGGSIVWPVRKRKNII